MTKPKKKYIGILIINIGFLFSIFSMVLLNKENSGKLPLIMSISGVLIIVFGFFKMLKDNGKI